MFPAAYFAGRYFAPRYFDALPKGNAMPAGTLAITLTTPLRGPARPVLRAQFDWTSSAGGAVSGNLSDYIAGEIVRVVFLPGAGGVQPTNLYDVVLLDGNGLDVLEGQGQNLSNVATTEVCPGLNLITSAVTDARPVFVNDRLELQVSNAGNAKSGTVVLYVR